MVKRKAKTSEFYCTECGHVQKPIKENNRWETFSTKCQKCGATGKISIRFVESEE